MIRNGLMIFSLDSINVVAFSANIIELFVGVWGGGVQFYRNKHTMDGIINLQLPPNYFRND